MAEHMIHLKPNNSDTILDIPLKQAINAITIRDIIGYPEDDDNICNFNPPNTDVPIDVEIETLKNIIEYLENLDKIDEWKSNFLDNLSDEPLFKLVTAANYLNIKSLLDITCKHIADEIKKCSTPQEIRRRFNIKNDFTPEEEEEVRRENAWCEN